MDFEGKFYFLKGSEDLTKPYFDEGDVAVNWAPAAAKARETLTGALGARHLAFLLGSGCSSHVNGEGRECGVPTMQPLARDFLEDERDYKGTALSPDLKKALKEELDVDVSKPEIGRNLERLMELLLSWEFALKNSDAKAYADNLNTIGKCISAVQKYIVERCVIADHDFIDDTILKLYQTFYRKLVYRDRSLPRPWIFTTNYDLFSEQALDRLGVPFCNGFSGVIERRFNPSVFRYALAEQMDISSQKWTSVDNYLYLCKLHGSITWGEDPASLYPIREYADPNAAGDTRLMIYPTPAKQNASLGSPYSDLFREFQSRIAREQSVLVTIGYSFSDEHVNNIIYQALTIPTFRLIAFVSLDASDEIRKLAELGDPRIWLIAGDAPERSGKAHYFDNVIHEFLPESPADRVEDAIRRVRETLIAEEPAALDNGADYDGDG